jgi:hypothetical protein
MCRRCLGVCDYPGGSTQSSSPFPEGAATSGEAEPEDGSAALGPVDVDAAALVPGHLGHDGQPQPRAGLGPGAGAR